jgi:hypothetical protein
MNIDYNLKEKLTADSYRIELGYELVIVIPHVYWLHLNGRLKNTISTIDSSPFYYFSPDHTERYQKRAYVNWGDPNQAPGWLYPIGDMHGENAKYEMNPKRGVDSSSI